MHVDWIGEDENTAREMGGGCPMYVFSDICRALLTLPVENTAAQAFRRENVEHQ